MDWSWILSILKTDGWSIDVGRYATSYVEFLRRIKRFYVRPSQVFPVYQIPVHRNSMCWHTFDTHSFLSYNFQLSKHIHSFFLSQARRPKKCRVVSFLGHGSNADCREEECALRMILHNVVCAAISFQGGGFSTLGESSPSYQSLQTRSALG